MSIRNHIFRITCVITMLFILSIAFNLSGCTFAKNVRDNVKNTIQKL